MTDLRKAAEMALEALEMFCEHGAILRPLETKEALHQALAMERFSEVNQEIEEALKQPKQEPVGYFSVNDYGNWEQNENGIGKPFYTAPPKRVWKCKNCGEIND